MTRDEYADLVKTDAFRGNAWEDLTEYMTGIVGDVIRFPNSDTLKNFTDVGYLASSTTNLQDTLEAFCKYDVSVAIVKYTCKQYGLHCSVFSHDNVVYVLCNKNLETVTKWKHEINKYRNIGRGYHGARYDTKNV